MPSDHNTESQSAPKIQRGRVDSITIYEVTESELETLASGTPAGYLFDLFLALFTIAISFLITLTTTDIKSDRLFAVYTILVVGCFIGAAVCFCLWLKYKKSVAQIIKTIKRRVETTTSKNTGSDPQSKEV